MSKVYNHDTGLENEQATHTIVREAGYVGQHGWVSSALRGVTNIAPGVKNFEWVIFGGVNNYSIHGEPVAVYGQANKLKPPGGGYPGPVWAGCFEARDQTGCTEGPPQTALVGLEVDVFGNGPDPHNTRVGIDIAGGKGVVSGAPSQTTAGLRISNTGGGGANEGTFKNGIHLAAPMDVGVRNSTDGMIGYVDEGTKNIGIALMGTYTEGALRFKAGNTIAFESTNMRELCWNVGALQWLVNKVQAFAVADDGVLHLQSQDTQNLYVVVNGQRCKIKLEPV